MARCILILLLSVGVYSPLAAQELPESDSTAKHEHAAIQMDSAPIIHRLPTGVRQVRRILREPSGAILVCEWETGTVSRLYPDGDVEQVAFGLNQPSDLALDANGNLYVSEYADGLDGDGAIVRLDALGRGEVLHRNLNGPSAMEFDERGYAFVAEYQTGRILRISASGERRIVAQGIEAPSAIAVDGRGRLYVTSSKRGELVEIDEQGQARVVADGLKLPSDLQFDGKNSLLVTNFGDGSLVTWNSAEKTSHVFGSVPRGTIATCFCEDNNFVLAHWEFDFLMKVTRTLKIKCPHCDQMIPVQLVPTEPKKVNRFEF